VVTWDVATPASCHHCTSSTTSACEKGKCIPCAASTTSPNVTSGTVSWTTDSAGQRPAPAPDSPGVWDRLRSVLDRN
jgi:hypothetical protein